MPIITKKSGPCKIPGLFSRCRDGWRNFSFAEKICVIVGVKMRVYLFTGIQGIQGISMKHEKKLRYKLKLLTQGLPVSGN